MRKQTADHCYWSEAVSRPWRSGARKTSRPRVHGGRYRRAGSLGAVVLEVYPRVAQLGRSKRPLALCAAVLYIAVPHHAVPAGAPFTREW